MRGRFEDVTRQLIYCTHRVAGNRKRDSLASFAPSPGAMALTFVVRRTGIFTSFVSKDCEIAPSISVLPEMPGSKYQNSTFKYM